MTLILSIGLDAATGAEDDGDCEGVWNQDKQRS